MSSSMNLRYSRTFCCQNAAKWSFWQIWSYFGNLGKKIHPCFYIKVKVKNSGMSKGHGCAPTFSLSDLREFLSEPINLLKDWVKVVQFQFKTCQLQNFEK